MNILTRIKRFFTKAAKYTVAFTPDWIKVAWMELTFQSLVKNGYKASSAVSACVRALAMSFPEPELQVLVENASGEKVPQPSHPLRKLLRKPNPDMGEAEFMAFAVTYAAIGGNCYIWKERNASGKVIALWPFHDGQMEPVPGESTLEGLVKEYRYDPGDGRKIIIPKNDVIQWKWMIDPDQPWRGIGAVALAARDTDSDTESSRYIYALLKNDAIPRVVITLTEGEELTPETSARLRASWHERYGGENRSEIAFLEAGMKVEKLGMNLTELAYETLKNIPESRICAAFGVPPVIAGLYVGLKRSDYGDGQARRSFTETTLAALWRSFESEMENGLAPEFDANVSLKFDLNSVRALQENVSELWARIDRAVTNGYIKRSEARQALGYNVEDYDEVYREVLSAQWVKPEDSLAIREAANAASIAASESSAAGQPDPNQPNSNPSTSGGAGNEEEQASRALAETKMLVYGRTMQRIRKTVAVSMAKDLDDYFARLADRVISRAAKAWEGAEVKALPQPEDLLTPKDDAELVKIIKRWYAAIAELSWETINLSLGVTVAFDLTDPSVSAALSKAGNNVIMISRTTREALREALVYGNEHGWSIQQLVRGDENQPGIRQIVEQTYKNRATTIARTELGNAQNSVAIDRYGGAGVAEVRVLDNGDDDDDEPCQILNGTTQTLAWAREHPLEHPNCTRAFVPVI